MSCPLKSKSFHTRVLSIGKLLAAKLTIRMTKKQKKSTPKLRLLQLSWQFMRYHYKEKIKMWQQVY